VTAGQFTLRVSTEKSTYAINEPIEMTSSLLHRGPQPLVRLGTSGEGPILFGIEQLDGPIDNGFATRDVCHTIELRRDVPFVAAWSKSGVYGEDEPLAEFWEAYFAERDLRLQAGTYRLIGRVDMTTNPNCSGDKIQLEAWVEVRVR
jgi:hypothetical protein